MAFVRQLGDLAIARYRLLQGMAAVVWSVIALACRPRTWTPAVRQQMARQLLFTGVDAIRLIVMVAVLAGVAVVAQAQLQLTRFGQSEMLGPILVLVIVREIGPLLVNLVVVARSGTAMATELATMRVRREVSVLQAQGIDPTVFLVMPRVLAILLSVFCLTVIFVFVAFGSGFLVGVLMGVTPGDPSIFMKGVLGATTRGDIICLVAKVILPSLLAGVICCREGLVIQGAVSEVPQAATKAVVRSIAGILLISALISVLAYT